MEAKEGRLSLHLHQLEAVEAGMGITEERVRVLELGLGLGLGLGMPQIAREVVREVLEVQELITASQEDQARVLAQGQVLEELQLSSRKMARSSQ